MDTAPPGQALFDVSGKTALVTGGTRGIGLMIARGLLDAGARVAISSRKEDAVAKAVEELAAHGEVHGIAGDVSTPDGARALAAATHEHVGGRLDLLVNNAGVTWGAPLEEFPDAGWDRVMHTNVEGVFHLTVALLPALRAAATAPDPARVINIGSIDGLRSPTMDNYSYAASKAAVHTLTRHLAAKLAAEHITVNAIAPGPFESRMTKFVVEDAALLTAATAEVPLARFGTAEDATGIVVFLASRAGAYLTGTVIPLDGGITGCR
ncbi:Rhamnolipids biosynthesis 3-oxoacyl-[acyl-carrier-protein] reductase [Paraconexibacter sp. AEG42_29]|uniref:Rhamnolipids biosynthesis 3-oxoacyl-[acyl-carrier-protein] reductase n=1 Tax=Paraconexibacter sp. AEG42_29 TaxID=2997339 RepID=A0AAU7AYL5_9ACTN